MMDLDLDNYAEWEVAQKIVVKFLKNSLESPFSGAWSKDTETELKSYLWVLSDNMWIVDFKKYAKEQDLEKYCEDIYKDYEMD
jgi:hypothetical protein